MRVLSNITGESPIADLAMAASTPWMESIT